MLRDNGDKVVVNVVLTKKQKEALKAYSAKTGVGLSAMLRIIIAEWMEARNVQES